MGHRKHGNLCDSRMLHEYLLDFSRCNFFTTTVDDLFDAACDKQVTVSIQISCVTRPEPAIREDAPVRHRIVFVALHDRRATHHDLTNFTQWQHGAYLIDNGNLLASRYSYRT